GDQVPADREEVAEHDLRDRAQPGHGRAHRGAEDGLLADRGVTAPRRAELLEQPDRRLEHPAGRRDVLAEEHHVGVAAHLLSDTPGDCLSARDNCHSAFFTVKTYEITAMTVATGTVSPSATRISLSTPVTGAGISVSTLSVPISSRGAPPVI